MSASRESPLADLSAQPIAAIKIRARHRKDHGDLRALADSIAEVGLLQPIGVTDDLTLVFGARRLLACRDLLGWSEIPARRVSIQSIVAGEYAENAIRKDFTPSELVSIVETLRTYKGKGRPEKSQNFGISTAKASKLAGFGNEETFRQARAVVDAAAREPETFGKLVDAMDRSGRVGGVYKRLVVAEKARAIAAEPPPLPTGPFRTIVADPPWHYARDDDPSHRGACPYPTLSVDEICAMPVAGLADNDAVLWLWVTNPNMRAGFEVLDAWGFTERTILTWVKPHFGCGHWLRGQTEHCLLGVRGRPTVTLTDQATVLHAPAPERRHSRKPDAFYELVETLCPGSKIEMFCRSPRPGWAAHGDEAAARTGGAS